MKRTFIQFQSLLQHSLMVEKANPERWLSPLLFAITVLLLFAFAFGQVEPQFIPQLLTAATYLTVFFSLQIAFSRILEPDTQDRVFEQLRSYPLSPIAWFLSKYVLVFLLGTSILLPTLIFANLFLNEGGPSLLSVPIFVIAWVALFGLCALGVLLSTMMLRSQAKQILYPLLYFPLTAPVLIAAVEGSRAHMVSGASLQNLMSNWLGLLVISGIIYFTLSLLLFGELIKPE